jgi:hypothetical protein
LIVSVDFNVLFDDFFTSNNQINWNVELAFSFFAHLQLCSPFLRLSTVEFTTTNETQTYKSQLFKRREIINTKFLVSFHSEIETISKITNLKMRFMCSSVCMNSFFIEWWNLKTLRVDLSLSFAIFSDFFSCSNLKTWKKRNQISSHLF